MTVAEAVAAVAPEVPAVLGLGLVCAGVYVLWGAGWTAISAGVPLLMAYVVRETGFLWRRRKAR